MLNSTGGKTFELVSKPTGQYLVPMCFAVFEEM